MELSVIWQSVGYAEKHKSNWVIKREKFSIGNCDIPGLITGIKNKLLNQHLGKLDVESFQFIKTNVMRCNYLCNSQYGLR